MSARRIALITGASEGLGVAFAKLFAERGHDLGLVARRGDRLEALADEIAASGKPRPLVFAMDLSKPQAAADLKDTVGAVGVQVEYLVNNAGFGTHGRFHELPAPSRAQVEATLTRPT